MRLKTQCRPRVEPLEDRAVPSADVVLDWNTRTLDAIKATGTNPLLASRALAITQVAVYDAVNAVDGTYAPYAFRGQAAPTASPGAAAAAAAHRTLVELFPALRADFDAALAASLAAIPDGPAENQGVAAGRAAAASILALRRHDGFDAVVPYTPGTDPGDWQPTPGAFLPALGAHWPRVTPFALSSGAQFRPPAPPALDTAEYAAAVNEVLDLGRNTSGTRTADQTEIARFWADGGGTSYALGHWNIIARGVSVAAGVDLVGSARLFARLNIAMADAIISTWDAKYAYGLWRPVTAIRAADADGNPGTTADTTWTPLLGTPNFPSYTSAHSTVSRSAATVLTAAFGADYRFTAGSEGLPGVTRTFDSFEAAAAEAGRSRVYGGIHYQFDNAAGQAAGARVGGYVVDNVLLPRDGGGGRSSAAAAALRTVDRGLRDGQVQPPSTEAPASWRAGVDTSAPGGVTAGLADPGGRPFGRAAGRAVWLDGAAGWGLFVDATPGDDSGFAVAGDPGEVGRMDRLTVLGPEFGHLPGRDHEAAGATRETPSAGARRTASRALAAYAGGRGVALTGLESDEGELWIGVRPSARGDQGA